MSDSEPETPEKKQRERTFNPISPVVLIIVGLLVAVELTLQAGANGLIGGPEAIGWRNVLAQNFALHPAVVVHIMNGGLIEPKVIWPFFTYIFVSRSFISFLITAFLILAMGKLISDRFSGLAVLIIFVGCTLAGALAFSVSPHRTQFPLMGAFPVFYGFIGSYTWIQISNLKNQGKSILPAFATIGMFLVFRLVRAAIYGPSNSWTADLAGLVVGMALAYVVAPSGRDRLKRWMRKIRNR